jgi:hypothetical protein
VHKLARKTERGEKNPVGDREGDGQMYYCLLGISDNVNEILRKGTNEHINGAQRSGGFDSATPQKDSITYTINILIFLLYLLTP